MPILIEKSCELMPETTNNPSDLIFGPVDRESNITGLLVRITEHEEKCAEISPKNPRFDEVIELGNSRALNV